MSRKKYINPNLIKIFSYSLTVVSVLCLNLFCTRSLLHKIGQASTQQYIDNCNRVTEGYVEAIHSTLITEFTALDIMYYPELFKDMSSIEIQDFLIRYSRKRFMDFKSIFYVDLTGKAYTDNGSTFWASDRDYFRALVRRQQRTYLSNPIRSHLDYSPIYVYGRSIYDSKGNVKGALCASIKLSTLSSIVDSISISNEGSIVVVDSEGKFVVHPESNWHGNVFVPGTVELPSDETNAFLPKFIETKSSSGSSIYVFYESIPKTDWQVAYCVPMSIFTDMNRTQIFYQVIILLVSIVIAVIMILVEFNLTNFFLKNQMIVINFDSLTHLPARAQFEREANKMLLHNRKSKFMLIETDIRGFKFLNQNLGEKKADKILIEFARLLNQVAQERKGILCRGYADHFYMLFKINSVSQAMKIFTNKIDEICGQIKNYENPFSPKFGIAFSLPNESKSITSVQHLIGHASFARKSIKDTALHQYAIYDEQLSKETAEESYIETHMEKALEDGEFFVLYQPKIDLKSDKIIGAEALVRWNNAKLGFMSPGKFIPLFEKNDFIVKVDFEVFRQVFKFIRKCLDEGLPIVRISVNMSRNHNQPEKFVHDFIALMKEYDVPPQYVEVELLERSSIEKNVLREVTLLLHKEGLTVAMDDFGSGESSLNMLSNIPVDVLKFDRSFLLGAENTNVAIDEDRANFIETLIDLGKNLRKHTIFEGVETQEQRDFLKSIDCDAVQGYFYSKPLNEEEFIKFIEEHI